MATNVAGTLNYDTKLDTKGVEDGINGISAKATAMGNLMADAIEMAVSKLKDMAKYVVEVGSSFEAQMSKVQAISGATGDELEALKQKAKDMGASTKFSATESAEAMEYMAMAGWKTEDMLNGIEGIMNLAAASGADLATTSDIVTDALTAMGYKAQDAGRLADVMAAAATNANTNVEMMGETFKYAAPVAGALGYSMEDVATAIGLMANSGIKASQAGTSLRSIFQRLSTGTGGAKDAFKELGGEMTDSDGKMRSLKDVMVDLRKGFKGLTEEEQVVYAKTIAGQEAMSGLLAIVNATDDDFNKLTNAVNNSSGAAENMANIMQDNLSGKITLLKSNLEGLGINIYEKIQEPLKKGIKELSGFVTFLSELFQKDGQDAIDFLIKGIEEGIPKLLNKGFDILNSIIDGINNNLDVILNVAFDIIVSLIDGLTENLPSLLDKAVDLIIQFALKITEPAQLQKLIESTVYLITALATGILKNLPKLLASIPNIIINIREAIRNSIKSIDWGAIGKQILNGLLDGMLNFGSGIKNAAKRIVNEIKNNIKDFFHIKSPSRLMADEVGKFIPSGIAVGIEANTSSALKAIDDMNDEILNRVQSAYSFETGKINASANMNTNSVIQVNSSLKDASIEMDGQKVGRLITPVVSQTLKTVGA